jgi:hypothetical protein
MSTMTCPPAREYTSRPDAVTATIAPAARVWLRPSALTVEVEGRCVPAGKTVKKPGPGDSVNVTVSATATASGGTDDGSATVIVSPACIAVARGGSRVSVARTGVTGTKRPADVAADSTNHPVTSTITGAPLRASRSTAPPIPTLTIVALALTSPDR